MKKFGLGKKGEGNEEPSRLALFGSRSKNKSPAPPTNNPYAQVAAPPDPYTQAKMDSGIIPPIPQSGNQRPPPGTGMGLPSGPAMKKGYGNVITIHASGGSHGDSQNFGPPSGSSGTGGGYGNDKFGNQAGYGQDKFGSNPYGGGMSTPSNSRGGLGGYGGLGRSNSMETTSTDANRDELFGDARERMQQRGPNGYGQPPAYDTGSAQAEDQDRSYGAYGDRQLTAEEEEEEDIDAAKQEIKFIKQQDVSSTRNALRAAAEAEEVGRGTLARLGAQGERLHNTDRNLDLAANHQRIAEDKAKELKVANRSMFRMHVDNPFTKGGRERRDQEILNKHRDERDQREETRQAAFATNQRMNQNFKGLLSAGASDSLKKSSLADRAKFQFEPDSDDEAMEEEIDKNLDQISEATGRLNLLAKAQGAEIEQQNRLLEGLAKKVRSVTFYLLDHCTNMIPAERWCGRSACHEQETTRAYPLSWLCATLVL